MLPLEELRLLVVDDDDDSRTLNTFLLEAEGAEVIAVDCDNQALNVLQSFKPHALLCDIAMPGVDGFGLLQQMKRWETQQGQNIPAVAVTAMVGQDIKHQIYAAGFQGYLTKPVEPDQLIATIVGVVRPMAMT